MGKVEEELLLMNSKGSSKGLKIFKIEGYKPGTIISTHLYNGAEAVVVFLAIQYIGCVVCLVDPLLRRTKCLIISRILTPSVLLPISIKMNLKLVLNPMLIL